MQKRVNTITLHTESNHVDLYVPASTVLLNKDVNEMPYRGWNVNPLDRFLYLVIRAGCILKIPVGELRKLIGRFKTAILEHKVIF
jgi:hypothetical protein